MEPREICVLKKWKGRNRCIVLSSVVLVTLHELWARMIAWVCKLGEPTAFIFSGSDLHWKQNHPSKQKEFFHLTMKNRWASCSNLSRPNEAATNRFVVCTGEFFVKIFVSATEFCRRNMSAHNWKIKSDRICATCGGDKILLQKKRFFHKNSPVHTRRFVAAMCRRNVLLQLVPRVVPHGVICRRDVFLQLVA